MRTAVFWLIFVYKAESRAMMNRQWQPYRCVNEQAVYFRGLDFETGRNMQREWRHRKPRERKTSCAHVNVIVRNLRRDAEKTNGKQEWESLYHDRDLNPWPREHDGIQGTGLARSRSCRIGCQWRVVPNTSVSTIRLCFKPDTLYYWNMQNDRICVSDSQTSLNRSTNNCPVVTGNCRGITETCGLAIRTAHCLACQQERCTGHNKLGEARTARLLTARHIKRALCAKCVSFLSTIAFRNISGPIEHFATGLYSMLSLDFVRT